MIRPEMVANWRDISKDFTASCISGAECREDGVASLLICSRLQTIVSRKDGAGEPKDVTPPPPVTRCGLPGSRIRDVSDRGRPDSE